MRALTVAPGIANSARVENVPEPPAEDGAVLVRTTAIGVCGTDRDPVGPYRITVPARRTLHLRFNDLTERSPVPRDTDFSSVFDSDVAIVVQHTRLDSRHAEVSLLSTTAYSES